MFDEDYEDIGDYTPKVKKSIEIPDFLKSKGESTELPTEEQILAQAVLNNVPNNTDIEKQNHLAELERACQNWDVEEWNAVITHASSHLMTKELDRRLEFRNSTLQTQGQILNCLQVKLYEKSNEIIFEGYQKIML